MLKDITLGRVVVAALGYDDPAMLAETGLELIRTTTRGKGKSFVFRADDRALALVRKDLRMADSRPGLEPNERAACRVALDRIERDTARTIRLNPGDFSTHMTAAAQRKGTG